MSTVPPTIGGPGPTIATPPTAPLTPPPAPGSTTPAAPATPAAPPADGSVSGPASASFDPTARPLGPAAPRHVAEPSIPAPTAEALAGTGHGNPKMADCQTWVGRMRGNGGQPVAVIIPPGVDTSRPVKVITYFHGYNQHLGTNIFGSQPPAIVDPMLEMARRENAIIVVPDCADDHSPVMNPRSGANPVSCQMIQEGALDVAQTLTGQRPTVADGGWILAGHSGGGSSIDQAMQDPNTHADHAYYFDATYAQPTNRPGVDYHIYNITGYTENNFTPAFRQQANVHIMDTVGQPGQTPPGGHDGAVTTGFAAIGRPDNHNPFAERAFGEAELATRRALEARDTAVANYTAAREAFDNEPSAATLHALEVATRQKSAATNTYHQAAAREHATFQHLADPTSDQQIMHEDSQDLSRIYDAEARWDDAFVRWQAAEFRHQPAAVVEQARHASEQAESHYNQVSQDVMGF